MKQNRGSGNPAPATALGVFVGMRSAVKHRLGKDTLAGVKVLVEGCGSVGSRLVQLLVEDNAIVYVTDINSAAVDRVVKQFGVQSVPLDTRYALDVDVYSPNALGGVLNDETIPILKCSVIAGAANNQLLNAQPHSDLLKKRDILYTPDYICNAGGLVNVSLELTEEGWSWERSSSKLSEAISTNLSIVFEQAAKHNSSTYLAAKHLAYSRLKKAAYDQGSHKTRF